MFGTTCLTPSRQVLATQEATQTALNKQCADRGRTLEPRYSPGQKVWLSSKRVLLQTESSKLSPNYIGTFEINFLINPVTVCLFGTSIHPCLSSSPPFPATVNKFTKLHSESAFESFRFWHKRKTNKLTN